MVPKFFGTIQFGRITLDDPDAYNGYLCTLEGEVEVVVRKRRHQRTLNQNAYYWGVVIKMIADETGHSSDEIHEAMKLKFLKSVITVKGEEMDTVKSTTEMDTYGFSRDYIDQIKFWAFDKLNIIIPEADSVE